MRTRAQEAITSILQNDRVECLRSCQTPVKRLAQLEKFVPGFINWTKPPKIQLLCALQKNHKIFFGVCDFLEPDDHRQYCKIDGKKTECQCGVPQLFCVFRDMPPI